MRWVRSWATLVNDWRCALLVDLAGGWLLKLGVTDVEGSSSGFWIVLDFSSRKKLPSRRETRAVSMGLLGFFRRSMDLVGAPMLGFPMKLG